MRLNACHAGPHCITQAPIWAQISKCEIWSLSMKIGLHERVNQMHCFEINRRCHILLKTCLNPVSLQGMSTNSMGKVHKT